MPDAAPVPPTVEQHVDHCWAHGNSIGDTRLRVARVCGERLTFEQVRRRFAELANACAPGH